MGLGKTLTTLALIAGSIDQSNDLLGPSSNNARMYHATNTTLVITPLSSESIHSGLGFMGLQVLTPFVALPTWEEQIIKLFHQHKSYLFSHC